LSTANRSEDEVMGVLAYLNTQVILSRLDHIDFTQFRHISKYSLPVMMNIYEDYLKSMILVENPIVALSLSTERNNVVMSIDKFTVLKEVDDPYALQPSSSEVKLGIVKTPNTTDVNILALTIADMIAYTTTYKDGKLGMVMDAKKAKMMHVPYINLVPAREAINVGDLQASQARDVIYEKLRKDWRLTFKLSDYIYSNPAMQPYSQNSIDRRDYFNSHLDKKGSYVKLDHLYVPKIGNFALNSSKDIDTANRYLANSRSVRGADTKGIGTITVGYMWYDMPRNLFVDVALAQDLLSFARKNKKKAVYSDSLNYRVVRILIHNDLTVYSMKAPVVQKDNTPGYYTSGHQTYFNYLDLQVEQCVVMQKAIQYPNIDDKLAVLRSKLAVTVAHFYIHPALLKVDLKMFPSFRAHSGMILLSNIKRGKAESHLSQLIARMYEANHCRNLYPFTRVNYGSQDPYFKHFYLELIVPRNIPRKLTSFNDCVEYNKITIVPKENLVLDLEVATQVAIETTMEDYERGWFDELSQASDDIRKKLLRAALYYPRYESESDYFPYLYKNGYNVLTDEDVLSNFGNLIIVIRREEEKEENKVERRQIIETPLVPQQAVVVDEEEESDSEEGLSNLVDFSSKVITPLTPPVQPTVSLV